MFLRCLFSAIVLLMAGCSDKSVAVRQPPGFTSFEITWYGGWEGRFSLMVDSGKIYLAMPEENTIRYGIMPDSLFDFIDTTLQSIPDSVFEIKDFDCSDCGGFAIKVIRHGDTLLFRQGGDVGTIWDQLLGRLHKFVLKDTTFDRRHFEWWKTRELAMPPPLPPTIMPPK